MIPRGVRLGGGESERYICRQHILEWVYLWILCVLDEAPSRNPRKIEGGLGPVYIEQYDIEEIGPTVADNLAQSLSVVRKFGYWFTKIEGLTSPVVYGQSKVVSCDSACNCRAAGLDSVYGCAGRGMFENNTKFRERFVKRVEMG